MSNFDHLIRLLNDSKERPASQEALEAACLEAYSVHPGHILRDQVNATEAVYTWRGGCLAWIDVGELPHLQTLMAHDALPWEHALVCIEPGPAQGGMRALLLKVRDVAITAPKTRH